MVIGETRRGGREAAVDVHRGCGGAPHPHPPPAIAPPLCRPMAPYRAAAGTTEKDEEDVTAEDDNRRAAVAAAAHDATLGMCDVMDYGRGQPSLIDLCGVFSTFLIVTLTLLEHSQNSFYDL
jgi:hypothetical protein